MTFDDVFEQSRVELGQMVESGMSAIGLFYPHAPYELILAYGLVPTLLRTESSVSGAYETSLQTFACSLVRNMYSQRESNQLPELTGLIFPGNTCDSLQNLGDIWRVRFPKDNVLRLTYPVADYGQESIQFMKEELKLLSDQLASLSGQSFSQEEYRNAVEFMQKFRTSAQTLYIARMLDSSLVSYSKLTSLIRGFLYAPGQDSLERLNIIAAQITKTSEYGELIEHNRNAILSQRFDELKLPSEIRSPRVAVVGGMTEPESIARILEVIPSEIESTIVLDLLSFGFKTVFTSLPEGDDSYEALAKSILSSPGEPTQEGLTKRVKYIVDLITNLRIDGLIICEQSFCDPDEFEAPSIEKAITEMELPVVRLPMDSELSDISRLRVRIQSFLETMQFE